jgi:hypothetical protein
VHGRALRVSCSYLDDPVRLAAPLGLARQTLHFYVIRADTRQRNAPERRFEEGSGPEGGRERGRTVRGESLIRTRRSRGRRVSLRSRSFNNRVSSRPAGSPVQPAAPHPPPRGPNPASPA